MGALTDKYCIVGVGETPHMRPSNRTTLSMACEAITNAMADAGLQASDIDGMTSYQAADSTTSAHVATALGMRLNYCVDIFGGGSSTEALVAHAIGLIEAGYAKTIVIFRSMNGRSGRRMGGQIPGGPIPVATASDDNQFNMGWGWTTPAQRFGVSAMRYLYDTGCTTRAFAEIAVAHRYHASLNPKARFRQPITIEDHQRSRWVVKPFRLLDCCQETDVSAAIIVTSRERAYDLKHPPVFIMGGYARTMTPNPQWNYSRPVIHYVAGNYGWKRAFGMAGITHDDVDFVSCYDAFTFTTLIQLEANGFCGYGEAGDFVKGGRLQIDHGLPSNLSGGHLSEGYTHGVQMVIENVRQLRHRADDACPGWREGKHTYDRSKGCRQLRKARICCGMAWGWEAQASCLILRGMAA
jgi:acetyl-CoA acetyltransferase